MYRAEFEAERDGELLLFANDAVLPFSPRYFYERTGRPAPGQRGNTGTACVTIQRADLASQPPGAAHSPICAEAARRAAGALAARARGAQP